MELIMNIDTIKQLNKKVFEKRKRFDPEKRLFLMDTKCTAPQLSGSVTAWKC
jgi:hypothetical protein